MSQEIVQHVEAMQNQPPLLERTCHDSVKKTARKPGLKLCSSYKACPLCLEDLVRNGHRGGQEVGALTFKGDRIEEELYHVGCVTMMLAHKGAIKYKNNKPSISWGTSPVSRQAVDGFLQVPSLEDKRKWIKFVDWRQKDEICVDELASLVAATLPIEEDSVAGFVETALGVSIAGSVTTAQLESVIIPYLDRTLQENGHKTIDIFDNGSVVRATSAASVLSQQSCLKESDDSDDVDEKPVSCTFCVPFWRRRRKL
jgi:hypothetical protein